MTVHFDSENVPSNEVKPFFVEEWCNAYSFSHEKEKLISAELNCIRPRFSSCGDDSQELRPNLR